MEEFLLRVLLPLKKSAGSEGGRLSPDREKQRKGTERTGTGVNWGGGGAGVLARGWAWGRSSAEARGECKASVGALPEVFAPLLGDQRALPESQI